MLNNVKRAVFFGAHTDDEMVAAGTLRRLVEQGAVVSVVTFAPAATEGDRKGTFLSSEVVHPEWKQAVLTMGCRENQFFDMTPSADLHPFRQRIADIAFSWCVRNRPDLAFILSPDDENPAHAVVGVECERVMRGRVPLVLRCNFPWNYTAGRTNVFVSLTAEQMRIKQAVVDCYQSQHFRYDYGKMLVHQAVADGLSVKVQAAEKFELIRAVV